MTDKLKCPFCEAELNDYPDKTTDDRMTVCRNPKCKYDGWHFPVEIIQQIIDGKKAQEDLKYAEEELKCAKHNYSVLSEQKEIAYQNYLKITGDLQTQLQKTQDAIQKIKDIVHTALDREFYSELRDDMLYISRIIVSVEKQE